MSEDRSVLYKIRWEILVMGLSLALAAVVVLVIPPDFSERLIEQQQEERRALLEVIQEEEQAEIERGGEEGDTSTFRPP